MNGRAVGTSTSFDRGDGTTWVQWGDVNEALQVAQIVRRLPQPDITVEDEFVQNASDQLILDGRIHVSLLPVGDSGVGNTSVQFLDTVANCVLTYVLGPASAEMTKGFALDLRAALLAAI